MSTETQPSDAAYIEAARRIFMATSDGLVDVDADAEVSHGGDDGAYVAAWVWITDDEAAVNDPGADDARD